MSKKSIFRILVVATIVTIAFSSIALAKPPRKTCPIESNTNIVVYGETGSGGVGTLSKSWITHFFDWWEQQDSSINYIFLTDNQVESRCNLIDYPNLELYVQPGGNAYYQQRSLGSGGKDNIINFINNGGSFFGTCAGFYYTASDYYWQGEYYDWNNLLGLYPTVEGSITDIADYDQNPGYALTPLNTGFNAIYYGGPTIGWRDTVGPAPGIIEATYTAIPGDLPAIVKYNNMLLTSVHLEAFENDGIAGLSAEDRIENYKYLANLINEVAETTFYVPPYSNPECNDGNDNDNDGFFDMDDNGCTSPEDNDETNCGDGVCEGGETWQTCSLDCTVPECSDEIDNDGDNLVDYPQDPGCLDENDNDETDPTGPIEVFFDGFEDGNLEGWILYGPGREWVASTDTSYEGNWAARAKRTGAGDDSFMETAIDVSDYGTVTFEYFRKLVGLDTADDFEVSYFNGAWHSVEHLGRGRANDNSFVYKSFSIPNTATKIRFKCEVGAVSEKCYVDNVKILGE